MTLVSDRLDLQGTLQAGQDLSLLATDTVKVRDTIADPFLAQAGRNLTLSHPIRRIAAQSAQQLFD
ncbi:hypothetical protein AB3R30_00325 [Leptolyngbyaceae cyanobacterium UHCC 1019]